MIPYSRKVMVRKGPEIDVQARDRIEEKLDEQRWLKWTQSVQEDHVRQKEGRFIQAMGLIIACIIIALGSSISYWRG